MKKNVGKLMLFGLLLSICTLSQCAFPQGGNGPAAAGDEDQVRGISPFKGTGWKVPFGKYACSATGFMGTSNDAGAFGEETYLEKEYQDWKKHYITSAGANGHLRVQRDYATYYDTVSEGIAYGMLLAVYFDDRPTFDGLEAFAAEHNNKFGLMHWKVDKDGNDICEIPNWDGDPGQFIHIDPTFAVAVTEKSAYTGKQLPLEGETMNRSRCSALDADLDMAAAIIFANKRWGASRYYIYRAVAMLQAIYEYGIVEDPATGRKLVAAGVGNWGGSWGNEAGWNPSYATLAWFPIFEDFMSTWDATYVTGSWTTVHDDLAYLIKKIDTNLSGSGLLPDWVDSSDLSVPKQSLDVSDRGPLPFNCYYDAVRVPWRLSLDKSWYNTKYARDVPTRLRNFINSIGGLANIVDGYMPTGYPFNYVFADRNNVYDHYTDSHGHYHDGHWSRNPKPADVPSYVNERGEEWVVGGLHPSPTFTAMFATVFGNDGDSVIQGAYEAVKASKESYDNDDAHPFNYYGNTLRLFSLLYLSGNMKNLYTCEWRDLLHADGNLKGAPDGYYYAIKNRVHGTYLAKNGRSGVTLIKTHLEDIPPEALWKLEDPDNNGSFALINMASLMGSSDLKYLNYQSGLSGGCNLGEYAGSNGRWVLKDNIFSGETHGNTLFLILPKTDTHRRLYAKSWNTETINTSTGGGKYWQFIRVY